MGTNLKRKNHFLPECYQRGFTDSSEQVWIKEFAAQPKPEVWAKFAAKPEPKRRNPCSVGRTRSLYIRKRNGIEDDKIEDFFGEMVETPFAALSQRIKDEQDKFSSITGEELTALARFVASQTVRTLAHKRCIEEQAGVFSAGLFGQ